ncbi:MAG: hypothetical protein OXI87_14560 [Albidovulum sp.]|nr:hypothetical protein [Albidovulum sp.]MDE0306079.1 hypothetical protein [Albidovulum sp.]MDE0531276.1 hypothetical protein [Albidovulum sp.]
MSPKILLASLFAALVLVAGCTEEAAVEEEMMEEMEMEMEMVEDDAMEGGDGKMM